MNQRSFINLVCSCAVIVMLGACASSQYEVDVDRFLKRWIPAEDETDFAQFLRRGPRPRIITIGYHYVHGWTVSEWCLGAGTLECWRYQQTFARQSRWSGKDFEVTDPRLVRVFFNMIGLMSAAADLQSPTPATRPIRSDGIGALVCDAERLLVFSGDSDESALTEMLDYWYQEWVHKQFDADESNDDDVRIDWQYDMYLNSSTFETIANPFGEMLGRFEALCQFAPNAARYRAAHPDQFDIPASQPSRASK